MSRRSVASLLAVGLLVALLVVGAALPVPYVRVAPGRTVDVLGVNGSEAIVRIDGHRTYATEGELRLTTISVDRPENDITLAEALGSWLRPDVAVMPFEAMYPEPTSTEQERSESAAQMVNSQDSSVAAALTELGYDLETHAEVTGVSPDGPSHDLLEPRDRIVTIQGTPVSSVEDVFLTMANVSPGDTVQVGIERDQTTKTMRVTSVAAPDDPKRALIGIFVGTGYDFPFRVRIGIDEAIGGPSAGLIFSLAVYDSLTPGPLTGGRVVAGTGSITAEGDVGPIGGIQQKIVGAEDSGATLFLVPPDNCDAAMQASVDDIRLVRADTLRSAVRSLQMYADNPSADLPRCPE